MIRTLVARLQPVPGSSLSRLVCALIDHRWAQPPAYRLLIVAGRVVAGRCTCCLLHVGADIEHRPCPLPTPHRRPTR